MSIKRSSNPRAYNGFLMATHTRIVPYIIDFEVYNEDEGSPTCVQCALEQSLVKWFIGKSTATTGKHGLPPRVKFCSASEPQQHALVIISQKIISKDIQICSVTE